MRASWSSALVVLATACFDGGATPATPDARPIPDGCEEVPCTDGTFLVCDRVADRAAAAAVCTTWDPAARLAEPRDQAKRDCLGAALADGGFVWVGLSQDGDPSFDVSDEGWAWDSRAVFDGLGWYTATGEPNDGRVDQTLETAGAGVEDCAALFQPGGQPAGLVDLPCEDSALVACDLR